MDENILVELLKELIEEYIEDVVLAANLIDTLDDPNAKYILAEIDSNKFKEFSSESKAIIKDIFFFYC